MLSSHPCTSCMLASYSPPGSSKSSKEQVVAGAAHLGRPIVPVSSIAFTFQPRMFRITFQLHLIRVCSGDVATRRSLMQLTRPAARDARRWHRLAGPQLLNPESWTLNLEAYLLPHALCATLYPGPLGCTLLTPQVRRTATVHSMPYCASPLDRRIVARRCLYGTLHISRVLSPGHCQPSSYKVWSCEPS